MKAYVFTDKALERYAGRFVWLSINTEDSKNAAFLTKYKIPALPTLLVVPAGSEAWRWTCLEASSYITLSDRYRRRRRDPLAGGT